ncbi:hypothetical protein EVAR_46824_1 [Eumeta japonica]|uniref:Uncharacterized protein n=1 Tax=Eumeta variegata TaxID=151549 RepID=A0A4C1ZLG8_EUMVA|nr:hypothetical protein EVAR_46824_1 [Eumeta japonica]
MRLGRAVPGSPSSPSDNKVGFVELFGGAVCHRVNSPGLALMYGAIADESRARRHLSAAIYRHQGDSPIYKPDSMPHAYYLSFVFFVSKQCEGLFMKRPYGLHPRRSHENTCRALPPRYGVMRAYS